MTNEELKSALMSGCPVESGGIIYKCVSAIIFRKVNGKIKVSAELRDRHTYSLTVAEPAKIKEVTL